MAKRFAEGGEAEQEKPPFDQTPFDPFGGRSVSRRDAERLRTLRRAKKSQAAAGFKPASEQFSDLSREYARLTEDIAKPTLGMAKGGAVRGVGKAVYGVRDCKKY